jgi:hypothetical protein
LQSLQNFTENGEMRPIRPWKPRTETMRAGPASISFGVSSSVNCSASRRSISAAERCFSGRAETPGIGMYSMKRTSTGRSRARRARGTTWSSFWPARITALIFTREKPAARAASIPDLTASSRSLPVIARNDSRVVASRLTFTCERPASARGLARRGSRTPFVVSARSGGRGSSAASAWTIATSPAWRVGSPPVSRTFLTPSDTKSVARRTISPTSIAGGSAATPASSPGLQYVQRRLQLSSIESLR